MKKYIKQIFDYYNAHGCFQCGQKFTSGYTSDFHISKSGRNYYYTCFNNSCWCSVSAYVDQELFLSTITYSDFHFKFVYDDSNEPVPPHVSIIYKNKYNFEEIYSSADDVIMQILNFPSLIDKYKKLLVLV